MDTKPLAGLTVLTTRPSHQAQPLCQLIEEKGGTTLTLPTIIIKPTPDSTELKNTLHHLPDIDIALFTSSNVVHALAPLWPQKTPPSLTTIAIGAGTRHTLEKKGIPVSLMPNEYNSEGLLTLPLLQDVSNQSVVIFCGENPRPLLKEQLQIRGANVQQAICYRRECPTISTHTIQQLQSQSVDFILSTSQESLRNLTTLFAGESEKWLYKQPLLVISKRMAALARELGFTGNVLVANDATDEAILHALITCVTPH